MSFPSLRAALVLVSLLTVVSRVHGQTTAAPASADSTSAEAKLAVVLRSYTLLQEENEQLKAAQEKLVTAPLQ